MAKNQEEQVKMYVADLIWSIAKRSYTADIPMPSEIWSGKNKIDRRSGKQIIDDLLKGLGGE